MNIVLLNIVLSIQNALQSLRGFVLTPSSWALDELQKFVLRLSGQVLVVQEIKEDQLSPKEHDKYAQFLAGLEKKRNPRIGAAERSS